MRRRDFIKVIAGSTAWPLTARAQQPTPVIGFLSSRSPGESAHLVAAFLQGLEQAGYRQGRNVHISFRWAEGRYDRLPGLAAELVRARVAVIASVGGVVSGVAAKAATATIPIVAVGGDPVKHGLVASFNRPGGNITAVNPLNSELSAKRLGLLRELVPKATLFGVLVNPNYSDAALQLDDVRKAAGILGAQIQAANASNDREIDVAFTNFVAQRTDALFMGADPFFDTRRDQIIRLAARHAMPTIYGQRAYVVGGGLMSYASSFTYAYHQAGIYAGRILKGEKPAEMPVLQPTKFELVINLRTAKALGLTVPLSLQAAADEVIE